MYTEPMATMLPWHLTQQCNYNNVSDTSMYSWPLITNQLHATNSMNIWKVNVIDKLILQAEVKMRCRNEKGKPGDLRSHLSWGVSRYTYTGASPVTPILGHLQLRLTIYSQILGRLQVHLYRGISGYTYTGASPATPCIFFTNEKKNIVMVLSESTKNTRVKQF